MDRRRADRRAALEGRRTWRSMAWGTPGALIRVPRGELKGMDTALGAAIGTVVETVNTNDDIVPLNLIQAGNGSWNRIGRKVTLKSLRFFGTVQIVQSTQPTTESFSGAVLRFIIVWDKQPSGNAIPSYDDIFGTTLQDGTEASALFDPLRYDNTGRFTVLRDIRQDIYPQAAPHIGGTANDVFYFHNVDEYVDLKDKETIYSGDSSPMTIADISSGALYFIVRSASGATTTVSLPNNFFARLRYRDV